MGGGGGSGKSRGGVVVVVAGVVGRVEGVGESWKSGGGRRERRRWLE